MRKNYIIYIFIFIPILCTSCDWFNPTRMQNEDNFTKLEGVSPALKQHLKEQDSLYSELILKIDSLTNGLNSSKSDIEKLQYEIQDLKSPGSLLTSFAIFSLILSLLALIISFSRTSKKVDKRDVVESFKWVEDQIKKIEQRMIRAENNIREVNKNTSTSKSDYPNSIDEKLFDLERKIKELERILAVPAMGHSSNNHRAGNYVNPIPETVRTGYAKVNSGKYFVELFNSKQEDSIYTIKIVNTDEGEFDIISLDKIKTINDLKDVVELAPGSCLLEEATSYKVIDIGLCQRVDDKAWVITKKLIIKVFK